MPTPSSSPATPQVPVPALVWSIKRSLINSVGGMPDGRVEVAPPASAANGEFVFPAVPGSGGGSAPDAESLGAVSPDAGLPGGVLRFAGSVTITAHNGMLRLVFAEPWLEPAPASVPRGDGSGAWHLTIADPYEPGARLTFATFERLERLEEGSTEPGGTALIAHGTGLTAHRTVRTAHGTKLTADGADLFASGPYVEGTELDDPRVIDPQSGTGDRA